MRRNSTPWPTERLNVHVPTPLMEWVRLQSVFKYSSVTQIVIDALAAAKRANDIQTKSENEAASEEEPVGEPCKGCGSTNTVSDHTGTFCCDCKKLFVPVGDILENTEVSHE